MRKKTLLTETGKQYAEAYTAHYTTKDLREALKVYRSIIAMHPKTPEAEYSRTQIQNIVNAMVSKHVLFDAQVNLVLFQFENADQPDESPAPVTPLAT